MAEWRDEFEAAGTIDPVLHEALYQPPVEHVEAPDDDDDDERWWDNTRFDHVCLHVGDAVVRYAVEVKIEGRVGSDIEAAICDDLVTKLGAIQGCACRADLQWER